MEESFLLTSIILSNKGTHETMKTWRNFFSPLIALLLILQMSTAFASPPGAHLELCFGTNGHFDVSPDFCDTHFNPPQQQRDAAVSDPLHHGDCLDLVIGCGFYDQAVPPGGSDCISKAKVQQSSSRSAVFPAVLFSRNLPQAGLHSPFHLNRQDLLPSPLASLRTVVLLI